MLISFIGSPCSGKTTTAAMLFSKLKEGGLPVEFLGEYARLYIAERRIAQVDKTKTLVLTDEDQWNIMVGQGKQEALMDQSLQGSVGGLVVSDTSSLNALLYMSPQKRHSPQVRSWVQTVMKNSYLVFYSKPVDLPAYRKGLDPNRVHTSEQSEAIDREIPEVLKSMDVGDYTTLIGSTEARLARAYQAVNSQLKTLLGGNKAA